MYKLILITLIAFLSTTSASAINEIASQPDKIIENIDNTVIQYPYTNIYFGKNDYIWSFNPSTKQLKKLFEGNNLQLSPDKSKLVYFYDKTENKTKEIHQIKIYYPATNITKIIVGYYDPNMTSIEDWSPDNRYIMLDAGTDVVRGKQIVDIDLEKIIFNTAIYESDYIWLNNKIVYTKYMEEFYTENGTKYVAHVPSIAYFDLNLHKENILKQGNRKYTYTIIEQKDNKIIFVKYPGSADSNETMSYYQLNIDNNTEEQIFSKDEEEFKHKHPLPHKYQERQRNEELKNNTIKLLPQEFAQDSNNIEVLPNKQYPNWVLIQSTKDNKNYIMDITNPKTLTKIGEGFYAYW